MRKFDSFVPVYFGKDSLNSIGHLSAERSITKALIVCDHGLANIGQHAVVILKEAGIESVLFTGVRPEPTDESIMKGIETANSHGGIDGIVGIGGGSSLDTAKCLNVLLNNPGPLKLYASIGENLPTKPGFPLILIPTTAGTGAECTFSSIFTCTETGQKMSIRKPNCTLASAAIIDPCLTFHMPPMLTISSGVDALCHAMEAFTVKDTNPVSDALAKEAITLAYQHLPRAVRNGAQDEEAREAMAVSATLAGMAFSNTLLHLAQAVGHSLGAVLHKPHGLMVGQALPEIMEYICDVCPDRVKMAGTLIGIHFQGNESQEQIGSMVKQQLYALYDAIGFPSLRDMGFTLDEALEAVPLVEKDGCFTFSPKSMNQDQIVACIRNIYEHNGSDRRVYGVCKN